MTINEKKGGPEWPPLVFGYVGGCKCVASHLASILPLSRANRIKDSMRGTGNAPDSHELTCRGVRPEIIARSLATIPFRSMMAVSSEVFIQMLPDHEAARISDIVLGPWATL